MSSYQEITNRQYVLDSLPLKDNSTYEEDYLQTLSDQILQIIVARLESS